MADQKNKKKDEKTNSVVSSAVAKENKELKLKAKLDNAKRVAQKAPLEGLVIPPDAERQGVQESIARSALKEANIFSYDKYKNRVKDLKGLYEGIRNKESLSRDDVIKARRKLMVFKELTNYLFTKEVIEENEEGQLVYRVSDKEFINITKHLEWVKVFEDKLKSFKQGENREEPSIYESIEKNLSTIKVKDFLILPLSERLELISNVSDWNNLTENKLVEIGRASCRERV